MCETGTEFLCLKKGDRAYSLKVKPLPSMGFSSATRYGPIQVFTFRARWMEDQIFSSLYKKSQTLIVQDRYRPSLRLLSKLGGDPPSSTSRGKWRSVRVLSLIRPKCSFSCYLIDMALMKWVRLGQGSPNVADLRECMVVPGNTTRLICYQFYLTSSKPFHPSACICPS